MDFLMTGGQVCMAESASSSPTILLLYTFLRDATTTSLCCIALARQMRSIGQSSVCGVWWDLPSWSLATFGT